MCEDDRGLSIDMLDADRLRQWAVNIDTYGYDLRQWADRGWLAQRLRTMADCVELAVREIGSLREDATRLQQLTTSLAAQEAKISRLRDALIEVVESFGPWHDEDCPGDDTCDCSGKPLHDRINAALVEESR